MCKFRVCLQVILRKTFFMTQQPQQVPAGWYPDTQNPSLMRWWDGTQWTAQTQSAQQQPDQTGKKGLGGLISKGIDSAKQQAQGLIPGQLAQSGAAATDPDALPYTFVSHVEGKNAKVTIYVDRVEWEKPRGISGGKVTAGIMTGGLSLLATGIGRGDSGTEMIPIKSISSVTTKRDGMLNSIVSIICAGNTITFRCGHNEAAQAKDILTKLILGTHPAQRKQEQAMQQQSVPVQAPIPQTPVTQAPDPMDQLMKLKGLLDAGILTQDEFDTKKAQIISQM